PVGFARGGTRCRADVQGIDAAPASHLPPLVHESRRNREAPSRLEPPRDANARPVAAVDVLIGDVGRLDRVHPAPQVVAVAHDPDRGLLADGRVEAELRVVPRGAPANLTDADLAERLRLP